MKTCTYNPKEFGAASCEERILEKVARAAKGKRAPGLRLGIGDDAALLRQRPGYEAILTCDWFLEGMHFLRGKHPADAVGWKCLARAVSDVVAMGGEAKCFLLGLALPSPLAGGWLDEFLGGLRRAAHRFRCPLAGGDTTRQERVRIHVTVVGEIRAGRARLRTGARPGNVVFVSGRLGEAEAGLRLLRRGRGQADAKDPRLRKHLYPEPRLALGRWLAEKRLATAMMDLSDGLSTDLARLCAASGVGARIEAERIPAVRVSERIDQRGTGALRLALHGGDDYELLFTVPRSRAGRVPKAFHGVLLSAIGEITSARRVLLIEENGQACRLEPGGWDAFAGGRR